MHIFSKILTQKSRARHADLLCKITIKIEQDIDSVENFGEHEKSKKRI